MLVAAGLMMAGLSLGAAAEAGKCCKGQKTGWFTGGAMACKGGACADSKAGGSCCTDKKASACCSDNKAAGNCCADKKASACCDNKACADNKAGASCCADSKAKSECCDSCKSAPGGCKCAH